MIWSKEIRELRERLCLSQTEFAQLLGVSFVSVNRWENGHFEPTIKIKRKLLSLKKKIETSEDYYDSL
jgi:DNA-binding transcriptional regulator YiaG